jgi:cellulose biosynthesis protein BcsQ
LEPNRGGRTLIRCRSSQCKNFKGGVGKSTVSVHLAQYLAMRGYRVCLIDCDSKGSATMMMGHVPDLDINDGDTLYPFIRNAEVSSLAKPCGRPIGTDCG